MPWRRTDEMEERMSFLVRAQHVKRGKFQSLCQEYGITRVTGYKWLKRALGSASVQVAALEYSRRPHHSPQRTSAEVEARVVAWRHKEDWGAKKIAIKLEEEGLVIPLITVNRILKRHRLVTAPQRLPQATQRFERSRPNELVQMDFKGDYPIAEGRCYPLTLVDDHSRFNLGAFPLISQAGTGVQRCLITVFEHTGVPDALLMDHGTPWWGTTNYHGLTWLSVWLIKQGIDLIFSGLRHPQTQGKIERFHRTLKHSLQHHGQPQTLAESERALDRFRQMYNYERPHEALGMAVPASRYQPSAKAYQPQPAAWVYPEGALVQRLNSQGLIKCPDGKRRFVCEALADEWVQVEEFDGRWLIKYRHQYVREIDLRSGRTLPPVRPERRSISEGDQP